MPLLKLLKMLPLMLLALLLAACGNEGGSGPSDGGSGPSDGGSGPSDGGRPSDGGSGPSDGGGGDSDGGDIGAIDECARGTHDCDDNSTCTDTADSFTCACNPGFSGDGRSCTDIDECAVDNGGCDPLSRCVNTPGSFSCGACPFGYTGDGTSGCVDIDECLTNNGGCDPFITCTNTPGSFTCGDCPTGYTGGGESGCVDVNECAIDNGGCGDVTAVTCENTDGGFTCACNEGHLLVEDTCVYTVPHVVASTPVQGAEDVYPSEFYQEPGFGPSGRGIRERVYVHLTFDMAMNTEQATVVVTDEGGLEEPRTIEGTWDDTGHVLTVVINNAMPNTSAPALEDETVYNVDFGELESSYGTPVDPEDAEYPGAQLTFTTGVRVGVLNHACIHVFNGPFATISAGPNPGSTFSTFNIPHTHYTINLPAGKEGEPNVGYSLFFPNNTAPFVFFLRDPGALEVAIATIDQDTFLPGPFAPLAVEEAPPACYAVSPIVDDPVTGEPTLGPLETGITHEVRANLDEDEIYMFRFSTADDATYIIVENATSY